MNLLPPASRIRPRIACEIAPDSVLAARAEVAQPLLAAVHAVELADGAVAPGLKPGNIVDRLAVVDVVKRALEAVGARPNARNADVTVVIPDGACRVLLLDFDALPTKLSEALPLVRFRLKKLVPFDAETAMVSFQVMSHSKQIVRVLAVCIPRDVLAEYESVVRAAGFEPGAVLPSTLAALAAAPAEGAALLVNAAALSVTTAITRDGVLLLHRTVDLQLEPAGVPAGVPVELLTPSGVDEFARLPLVSLEDTAGEWAQQEPLPEYRRDPYTDRVRSEEATQAFDQFPSGETTAVVLADRSEAEPMYEPAREAEPLPAADFAREIAQAVSVAAAYFEDTLAVAPDAVLASGTITQADLEHLLRDAEMTAPDGLRVRSLVAAEALAAGAGTSQMARPRLGSVWGALCG